MTEHYAFTRDRYRTSRGNYSRRLDVSCRKCGNLILTYQKDGPGNLRRIYLDRILSPAALRGLQARKLSGIPHLSCTKCREILAVPYLYTKENRKAFRVFQDAIIKMVRRLN